MAGSKGRGQGGAGSSSRVFVPMFGAPPPLSFPSKHPQQREKRRKAKKRSNESDQTTSLREPDPSSFESLPWSGSNADSDDPFNVLAGGDEGGFLTLEEIEESDYGFIDGIPHPIEAGKSKNKKKRGRGDSDSTDRDREDEDKSEEKTKKRKKRKSSRKKKKKEEMTEESKENYGDDEEPCPELVPILPNAHAVEAVKDEIDDELLLDDDELLLDDDEIYAWKELRLHPLLIQSIRRLGFREPTPIQKACIPAAAHQGKDVIGAAETGSGKTLAFGLPILQRLLEEQEKAAGFIQTVEKSVKAFSEGPLRALIITPTRELALQVSDHLKAAAKNTDIRVVPIVGGMSLEKQDRLLKWKPEIVVGTPGRLWELMSGGNEHLVELHSLSFFVLDEADRMIENGHFRELQSIIDMLPTADSSEPCSQSTQSCKTIPNLQRKKRQTFVFSATISLSNNFRKKLKRSSSAPKSVMKGGLSSIESLSERAGMKADAAVVDLTNAAILADKLEESFIECREEDKEAYLYYILRVHGQGRTIVFCTSIAALHRISALLHILGINTRALHGQMQQRDRLKAIDHFRGNEHSILIATDVAARGIDIPGIRTVVHYQLPHSAEVYIHRSGRTARASSDGCCIALISPSDKTKFNSLCKSMSKETLRQFPLDDSYMPEVMKRLTLARQIDKLLRKNSQENVMKKWLKRNAKSMELTVEESGSEDETVLVHKQRKMNSFHLKRLQEELNSHLTQPLQPKSFSRRFLAGAGVSPVLQKQLEQLSRKKSADKVLPRKKRKKRVESVVIGQDCVEPLQALRSSGHEVCVNVDRNRETRKIAENLKRKRQEEKKRSRDKVRKQRNKAKEGML